MYVEIYSGMNGKDHICQAKECRLHPDISGKILEGFPKQKNEMMKVAFKKNRSGQSMQHLLDWEHEGCPDNLGYRCR